MRSRLLAVLVLAVALLSSVLAAPAQARFASPASFFLTAPSRLAPPQNDDELLSASWAPDTPFAANSVVWHGARQYVAKKPHISDLQFDLRLWTPKPDDEEPSSYVRRPLRLASWRQFVIIDAEEPTSSDPSATRDIRHTTTRSRSDWYDWHAVRRWFVSRTLVAVVK